MKLVNIFSILGLVMIATACGSSQPTTTALGGTTGYPQYGNTYGYGSYGGSLFSGPYGNGTVTSTSASYTASVPVNAGDRLNVNLSTVTYDVSAYCGGIINLYSNLIGGGIQEATASLTLNGQALNSGSIQAPAAGTLTLTVNANPASINCPLGGHPVISGYQFFIGNVVTH